MKTNKPSPRGRGASAAQRKPDLAFTVEKPGELLEFLLGALAGRSRNSVKSLLTRKAVFVDGAAVSQYNHPLCPGQKITVRTGFIPERPNKIKLDILYEDTDILVINKPAGLLSIATDKEKEQTAYHMMTEYVRQSDPDARVFAVHRLDRDTSGVLMAAKSERMKLALQENWAQLVSVRGYIAVVEGHPAQKSATVRSWLKETETMLVYSSGREGDGQEAITHYTVEREGADYSLLSIRLDTGRKNQIRVHMKDIGHPVVGDKKYGAKTNPLKRLCLHANELAVQHPFTGARMRFLAKTPGGFGTLTKGEDAPK